MGYFLFSNASRPVLGPVGIGSSYPEGKAAGAWIWPLTSIYCRD